MAKIWNHYMKAYYVMHPTPPGSFVAPSKDEKKIVPKKDNRGGQLAKHSDTTLGAETPSEDTTETPPITSTAPEALVKTEAPSSSPAIGGVTGFKINGAPVEEGAKSTSAPEPAITTAPDFRSAVPRPVKATSPTVIMTMPNVGSGSDTSSPSRTAPATDTATPTRLYPYNAPAKYAPVNP